MVKEDILRYAKQGGKILLAFLVIVIVLIIAGYLFIDAFRVVLVLKTFNYVVQNIVNVSGMSTWLAKGLVLLILIPFIWAIKTLVKIGFFKRDKQKKEKRISQLIVLVYIALFFFSMYLLGRNTYFNHATNEPSKFYTVTPEGIRFFDSPGFDPVYGKELKPVTPQLIEQIRRSQKGLGPKHVTISENTEFFDSITREPKIWYYKDSEGNYEFFDQPGYHPVYYEDLKPINKDVVIDFNKTLKQEEERQATEKRENELISEAAEKEKAKKEKLESKKLFIQTNINSLISNDSSISEIGIAIKEKGGNNVSPNSVRLKDKIGDKISKENVKGLTGFFKKQFYENGYFEDLLQGNSQVAIDLELGKHIDYVVLGDKKSTFSQDARLGDLISCSLELDLKIIMAETGEMVAFQSIKESGIGIDNNKAEDQAIERITGKVESFILSKIK